MKFLQAGIDGLIFVSHKDQNIIKTVCQTVTMVTAMIVAGKWAVIGMFGIMLFGMMLREG